MKVMILCGSMDTPRNGESPQAEWEGGRGPWKLWA
jgi:hypothetical protein